jgi:hypothetical protein
VEDLRATCEGRDGVTLGNATYLRRSAKSEKHLSVIGRISEGEWSRVFRVTPASGVKTLPVFSHGEAARRFLRAEEAGQLTESVRSRPYSVLLLDEKEKAHPGQIMIDE